MIKRSKYWIWFGIEMGLKGSRSFSPILRAVQIQIKILKKDLDPGFSNPLARSSNSLGRTLVYKSEGNKENQLKTHTQLGQDVLFFSIPCGCGQGMRLLYLLWMSNSEK